MRLNCLLNTLNIGGVNHGFLRWLSSYLSSRNQSVVLEGVSGPVFKVLSEVPQGSVLGPYLFAAFFSSSILSDNDVQKLVLYADDLTMIDRLSNNSVSSVRSIISRITKSGLVVNRNKCP